MSSEEKTGEGSVPAPSHLAQAEDENSKHLAVLAKHSVSTMQKAIQDEGDGGLELVVQTTVRPTVFMLAREFTEAKKVEEAARLKDDEIRQQELAKIAEKKRLKDEAIKQQNSATAFFAKYTSLDESFTRHTLMHKVAAKHFNHLHFYCFFLLIQIVVAAGATLAFVASAKVLDDAGNNYLTLGAGILGIIASFLHTMDRYWDFKTKAEMHLKAGNVYTEAKSQLRLFAITITQDQVDDDDANVPTFHSELNLDLLKSFEDTLKNLSTTTGDLVMPQEISQAVHYLQSYVHEQIKVYRVIYFVEKDILNRENSKDIKAGKIGPFPVLQFTEKAPSVKGIGIKLDFDFGVENDFMVSAYAVLENEMTKRSCIPFFGFPWFLPNAQATAINAHKIVQSQLFDLYFRHDPRFKRLKIHYDEPSSTRNPDPRGDYGALSPGEIP